MTITLVLADDHHLVRAALRQLLESESDLKVVAETSDGLEALALVERHRPNVLIVDLMLPGMSGLGVTREVVRSWPDTGAVVLSMHANDAYVTEALRSGALGYVIKSAKAEELFLAVRRAAAGRRFLCSGLSERSMDLLAHGPGLSASPLTDLSEREQQALQYAAEGATNAQIGECLFISPRTAEKHRASAMRKLGLRSAHDLVRFAVAHGLIPGDLDIPDAPSMDRLGQPENEGSS